MNPGQSGGRGAGEAKIENRERKSSEFTKSGLMDVIGPIRRELKVMSALFTGGRTVLCYYQSLHMDLHGAHLDADETRSA